MKKTLLICFLLSGCSSPTFEASSHVRSVRLLATRADPPYAAPGESVSLEALAFDGRANASEPMQIYWLEEPCINPVGDAYYQCFDAFRARFRAGAVIERGFALGNHFSFRMPDDVIDAHASVDGTPYGLAIVFSLACAGRVAYRPGRAGTSPDAVPFVCLDASGRSSSADDFVFAYSLVYSFAERRNENPILGGLSFGNMPVDANAGITVDRCTRSAVDDCPATKLDLNVPAESQELDPSNSNAAGEPLKEFLYAQYYSTAGKIDHDTVLLFDAGTGRLGHTENDFRAPTAAGDYLLWAVLHDNRGGVAWQEIPLHAR